MITEYDTLAIIREITSIAVVTRDDAGTVLFANRNFEMLFGYTSRNELIGTVIDNLIPIDMRAGHRQFRIAYNANPSIRQMGTGKKLEGLKKNGDRLGVVIILVPAKLDNQDAVIVQVYESSPEIPQAMIPASLSGIMKPK